MATSRSLLGTVLRRSSRPLLPSPAASSSPLAGQFLAFGVERPAPSPYSTPAAARSLLARTGLSPAMDKVSDDHRVIKVIRWFLRKIRHPSAFTGEELKEWGRNQKPRKDTHPSGAMFVMLTGALVISWVHADWKYIKECFTDSVGGLKTGGRGRTAQDKD